MSKFQSVEEIRHYLEGEVGDEALLKVYPIMKEFVRSRN